MSTTHGFPGLVPSGVELIPTVAHPPANAVAANARNRSGTAISKRRTAPPFLEHPLTPPASCRFRATPSIRGQTPDMNRAAEPKRMLRGLTPCVAWWRCGRAAVGGVGGGADRSGSRSTIRSWRWSPFTPYAALTLAAAGGRGAGCCGAGRSRAWRRSRRWRSALAMVPRALAGPEAEARGPRLVVMTSNAYVGRADARAVLRIAREHDVDVLSLQELRPELMRRLDRVGRAGAVPGRGRSTRARARPGSGVLSRRPLESVRDGAERQGPRAARGRAARAGRAAGVAQGRPSLAAGQRRLRARAGRRRSRRCRAPTRAATSRSWPATSTPRSTTPSCARCSTAAGSTPPTPSARASRGPGPRAGAARSR